MANRKYAIPSDFFPSELVSETYSFIDTLTRKEILDYRKSYKRELNKSSDDNVLPYTTSESRRCFLYLTASYERDR